MSNPSKAPDLINAAEQWLEADRLSVDLIGPAKEEALYEPDLAVLQAVEDYLGFGYVEIDEISTGETGDKLFITGPSLRLEVDVKECLIIDRSDEDDYDDDDDYDDYDDYYPYLNS